MAQTRRCPLDGDPHTNHRRWGWIVQSILKFLIPCRREHPSLRTNELSRRSGTAPGELPVGTPSRRAFASRWDGPDSLIGLDPRWKIRWERTAVFEKTSQAKTKGSDIQCFGAERCRASSRDTAGRVDGVKPLSAKVRVESSQNVRSPNSGQQADHRVTSFGGHTYLACYIHLSYIACHFLGWHTLALDVHRRPCS